MRDDMTLVREFAASQSEPAFATLVERHIGLVHSAARRQVGDDHLAEEIAQAVFIILARKAATLGPKTILSAWLYRTTRYAAADALKTRRRREAREQEAYMQATLNQADLSRQSEATAEAWTQLAPLLDDAMNELGETDRAALVLRYFENQSAREMAGALGMQEDAVQKRVTRALDKLRARLVKRGVTLTATVIAGAVAANAVQAAPAGLAVKISLVAAKGAAVTASITTIVKGTMKTMTWLKLKLAVSLGATALLVGSTVTVALSSGKTDNSADTADVIAFKDYLSHPNHIARIEYTELPSGRRFVGAADGTNSYSWQLAPGLNPDQPISATNKMRSGFLVGRLGDMRWQITGFGITEATRANVADPDPYTGFADSSRIILNGILNLGPQHIEPGSFRWQGDKFEADLSQAYADVIHTVPPVQNNGDATGVDSKSGLPNKYTGKITRKNGLVWKLVFDPGATYLFDYDDALKLPKGIPCMISGGGKTTTIQKLVLADESGVNPHVFDPERFVVPELRTIKIVSNSVTVTDPKPNKQATQITLQDLSERKPALQKNTAYRRNAVLIISSVVGLSMIVVGFKMWKRR